MLRNRDQHPTAHRDGKTSRKLRSRCICDRDPTQMEQGGIDERHGSDAEDVDDEFRLLVLRVVRVEQPEIFRQIVLWL